MQAWHLKITKRFLRETTYSMTSGWCTEVRDMSPTQEPCEFGLSPGNSRWTCVLYVFSPRARWGSLTVSGFWQTVSPHLLAPSLLHLWSGSGPEQYPIPPALDAVGHRWTWARYCQIQMHWTRQVPDRIQNIYSYRIECRTTCQVECRNICQTKLMQNNMSDNYSECQMEVRLYSR